MGVITICYVWSHPERPLKPGGVRLMYDMTIVGAGPAGANLARLIGDKYKILLKFVYASEGLYPGFYYFFHQAPKSAINSLI